MNEEQLIKKTFDYVATILEQDLTGHDVDHIKRVYKNGLDILEKTDCHKLVVKLALILHDIDDPKITKDYNGDCTKARTYLNTLDLNKDDIEHVCDIINKMSFSKNKEKKQVLTLEGQVVQDADRIDALGAIGIARTFQYGGANRRTMNDSIDHFDDKLLHLYKLINTEEGKKIAFERQEIIKNFYIQFKKEQV